MSQHLVPMDRVNKNKAQTKKYNNNITFTYNCIQNKNYNNKTKINKLKSTFFKSIKLNIQTYTMTKIYKILNKKQN